MTQMADIKLQTSEKERNIVKLDQTGTKYFFFHFSQTRLNYIHNLTKQASLDSDCATAQS